MKSTNPTYRCPRLLRNGHLQTIFPRFYAGRWSKPISREYFTTSDNDRFALDWYTRPTGDTLIIALHGLEGCGQSHYIRRLGHEMKRQSLSFVAVNFRGCDGGPNAQLFSYHSGFTTDLRELLISEVTKPFKHVFLIGFSLGANVLLKYLGEEGNSVPENVKAAMAVSVPSSLESAAIELARPDNKVYMRYFLKRLKRTLRAKKALYPDQICLEQFDSINSFHQYDRRYTAPHNSFASEQDYWNKCSANQFLRSINLPTLILNSKDDPFLGAACYPESKQAEQGFLTFEYTEYGGHVGFLETPTGKSYVERRAISFFESCRNHE